jgi:integrase
MARPRKLPSGLWKRGDAFYARFRVHGREVRRRLSTDFDAACELLNELRVRADRADFDLIDNDFSWKVLKTEFLKWARQSLRPRVAEEYERDLTKFEQFTTIRSVQQIQPALIFGFREWRLSQAVESRRKPRPGDQVVSGPLRTVSPRTVNRQVGTVANMLNKGVEWGRIGSNPIKDLRPLAHEAMVKQRRALSADELQRLFDSSPEHLQPVWRMFMCTGVRKGELVALRFEDVDFERKVAVVRASTAKNGKAREIPMDDGLLAMLAQLKSEAKQRQRVPGRTPEATERQRSAFSRDHVFVTKANSILSSASSRGVGCCV